jgi:hypothetical protein
VYRRPYPNITRAYADAKSRVLALPPIPSLSISSARKVVMTGVAAQSSRIWIGRFRKLQATAKSISAHAHPIHQRVDRNRCRGQYSEQVPPAKAIENHTSKAAAIAAIASGVFQVLFGRSAFNIDSDHGGAPRGSKIQEKKMQKKNHHAEGDVSSKYKLLERVIRDAESAPAPWAREGGK